MKIIDKLTKFIAFLSHHRKHADATTLINDAATISNAFELAKAVKNDADPALVISSAKKIIESESSGLTDQEKEELQKIVDDYIAKKTSKNK